MPNFVLAAPVLLLSLGGICAYARRHPRLLLLGGLPQLQRPGTEPLARSSSSSSEGFFAPGVAVFIYPWAFCTATALLVMHVQVCEPLLLRQGMGAGWPSELSAVWLFGHAGLAAGSTASPAPLLQFILSFHAILPRHPDSSIPSSLSAALRLTLSTCTARWPRASCPPALRSTGTWRTGGRF